MATYYDIKHKRQVELFSKLLPCTHTVSDMECHWWIYTIFTIIYHCLCDMGYHKNIKHKRQVQ